MGAGSSRRVGSALGAFLTLIVVVAGILFSQSNGGARPAATVASPTSAATATMPPVAPTIRAAPTATIAATTAATRPPPTATATPRAQSIAPTPNDGLATVALGALPPEARQTIALIDRGGPFPYDRDGITFGNREGLLPSQSNGYYREYTVITPGSADRGERRIIAGRDGQLYYTDDHYESFRRVVR
jgi:ribonuclease T1